MRPYWTGPLLQLLLPAAWGVQVQWSNHHRPRAESQPRKIATLPINFQASRHTSALLADLSVEHQLEDRSSVFLCRGQRTPAPVVNDRRNLTFIHIPRCAGTSIEDCSNDDLVGWGSQDKSLHGLYTVRRGQRCFKQHIPPSVVPELYADKVTFCVVRNPYERMISEYHFPLTKGFADRAKAGMCNKQGLNDFTIESLKAIKHQKDPYIHDCHLLPQTAYVYGWDAKTSRVTREHTPWCKHKIRQEHLLDDFNQLMVEYGYTYRLTSQVNPNTFAGPYWNCTHVTPEDFGPEARAMINEVWKDDFELLNFTMLPVVREDGQEPALVQEGRGPPKKGAVTHPPKKEASKAAPAPPGKAAGKTGKKLPPRNEARKEEEATKEEATKEEATKEDAPKSPPGKAAGKKQPPKASAPKSPPGKAASKKQPPRSEARTEEEEEATKEDAPKSPPGKAASKKQPREAGKKPAPRSEARKEEEAAKEDAPKSPPGKEAGRSRPRKEADRHPPRREATADPPGKAEGAREHPKSLKKQAGKHEEAKR